MQLGTDYRISKSVRRSIFGFLFGVLFGVVATEVDADTTGSGHSKTTGSVGSM